MTICLRCVFMIKKIISYLLCIQVVTGKSDKDRKSVKMLRLVSDYNKHMGGIDKNNATVGNYGCDRKSYKWTTECFSILLKKRFLIHLFYIRNVSYSPNWIYFSLFYGKLTLKLTLLKLVTKNMLVVIILNWSLQQKTKISHKNDVCSMYKRWKMKR